MNLEYSLCRTASVMDSRNSIIRSPDGLGSFTRILLNGEAAMFGLRKFAGSFATGFEAEAFPGKITQNKIHDKKVCLEEAHELISGTKCLFSGIDP